MAQGESHSVRNGVIATIIGGIALAALGQLWPPAKMALLWLWGQVVALVDLFDATYATRGWTLANLGLHTLITIMRFMVALRASAAPPHSTYVEDVLFDAKWRWSWLADQITNLWCFCPRCDSELVYDDSSAHSLYSRDEPRTLFLCEHCNRTAVARIDGGDKDYALGAVRREIRRRIRTGQYKTAANAGQLKC
jgi:hypothetical protein